MKSGRVPLASQLSKFSVVMAMPGVSNSLGPQFMVKIRDVTLFVHQGVITSFAEVAPGANKFLHIYYSKAKEYLTSLEPASVLDQNQHTYIM